MPPSIARAPGSHGLPERAATSTPPSSRARVPLPTAAGAAGAGAGASSRTPRARSPPTPKRVGPRQTKKRFTGEDALTPQERKAKDAEGIRLAKALARLGVASRRASEALVFAGRVTVNGARRRAPQHSVSLQRDVVAVDGKVVDGGLARDDAHYYFLLNKPKGYLCSNKAAAGRGKDGGGDGKLVLDLFEDFREGWRKKHPGKLPPRLFTVGRLDVNTTGMLLVTTDGQWCQRVAHPSSEVVKSYIVTASSRPTKAQLKTMSEGAVVDGAKVTPTRVESLQGARDGGPANRVLVEVVDGRNRGARDRGVGGGDGEEAQARSSRGIAHAERVAHREIRLAQAASGGVRPGQGTRVQR